MNRSSTKPLTPSPSYRRGTAPAAGRLAALLSLVSLLSLPATVLDNFSGAKTGWTDTLNGGTISQAGGQFTVATAHSAGAATYSVKTTTPFANVVGDTLELRVNVNGVTPGSGDANPMAILAWVPSGGTPGASGYSLSVGAANAVIKKGAAVLYSFNFPAAYGTNIQNTNITLVLRMTPSGPSVVLDARVYKQTGTATEQDFTCLFEYTVTDSAGLIATPGYAALGASNLASPAGASIAFANLQYFVLVNSVLDDFSVNNNLAGWQTFTKASAVPGITTAVTEHPPSGGNPGYVDVLAGLANNGGFAGAYYAAQTFMVVDGSRLELSIDFDNPGNDELNGNGGSYSALGYLPVPNLSYVTTLIAYHIAHDRHSSDYLVVGKNYDAWWSTVAPDGLPVMNCRYTLIMTGEGVNERIEARLENLNLDVNAPNRVAWQNVFVDTPAQDISNEILSAPYLGYNGSLVMIAFDTGPVYAAHVIFRNARVSQSIGGASPPSVLNVSPADGAAFVPSPHAVSFEVRDAVGTPASNLSLTLNGVTYTSASPGVTVTGTAKDLVFTLTGALAANVNYVGSMQAVNSQQLVTSVPIRFDTFGAKVYVVESEDFNYSADGIIGGAFIDNPKLIQDDYVNYPYVTDPSAYNGQAGMPGTDYHTSYDPNDFPGVWFSQDIDHVFRWNDPLRTTFSPDTPRAQYVTLGGTANGYNEVGVEDIHDGDWLNYTHTYPLGAFGVYLRQEQYLLAQSLVTLERVTSDPTQPNQTTTLMGSFLGSPNGSGPHFNVPLTDAAGNPVVVRFSGTLDTVRLNNRITGNASTDTGFIEQNYFVLAPVPDPGKLRPFVPLVSPSAGQTVSSFSPATYATIANRDTAVDTSSIKLSINGIAVPATTTPNPGGAQVSWSLSVLPPAATFTNTLTFKDSDGVSLSFSWTYSYPFLSAANSLPAGSLSARGFQTRTAWSANGGNNLDNSLARALEQLAVPPPIQVNLINTSIVSELNWNISGTPNNVPGLCPGSQINIAVESTAYLHLTAGAHRFNVSTDDRAGFYSGTTPWDPAGTVLFEAPGNTAYQTFDFVVGAEGLYPFRSIWEQTGGGAVLQLAAVDPDGVNPDAVVGDPSEPPGAVDVYYPVVCFSAPAAAGPYAPDATATATAMTLTTSDVTGDCGSVVNQMVTGGSGTFSIPISGSARFFRLCAPRPSTITGSKKAGSSIVLTYQLK